MVEGRAFLETGLSARLAARQGKHVSFTSGLAQTYLQANLIILPARYASDFRLLCRRNPAPCPLLAESKGVGRWDELKSWVEGVSDESIAKDVDLRHDFPRYMVYQDGVLSRSHCLDVADEWQEDHFGFLIGCSYSFESALSDAGLIPPHISLGRNVAMYRTNIPLCPAGVFVNSTYVVSMRPYKRKDVEQTRDITRPYTAVHGEPIAWGWEAVNRLGIANINAPEWGDAPLTLNGVELKEGIGQGEEEIVPVFWACGVTPQEAIVKAKLQGTVIGHAPGHMMVLDIRDRDVLPKGR
jgi:uncharacterized protein YcsI (UPF0317 family)